MTRAVRGACRRIYGAFDEFAPCGVWTLNAVEAWLADEGATRRSLRVFAHPPAVRRVRSVAALPCAGDSGRTRTQEKRRRSTGAASARRSAGPHEDRP